jgi:hypothetical protein
MEPTMTDTALTTDQCKALGRIAGKDFARTRIREHFDPEMRSIFAMTEHERAAYFTPDASAARERSAGAETERQRMVLMNDKLMELAGRGANGESLEAYVEAFGTAFCEHFDAYTDALNQTAANASPAPANRAEKRKAAALAKKAKAP